MTSDGSRLSRRQLLGAGCCSGIAMAMPAWVCAATEGRAPTAGAAVKNRAPLAAQPYYALPVGAVRPAGWLRRQLEIQADGMGGRLDETWPDVGPNSGWLGGDGESWERGPYFLDGLLPLAHLLDSETLKAKAQRFIDWTLANPWPNGMIGPRKNDDWWPRMVMLKVLTQYQELTGDPRVIPFMTAYFHHQLDALPSRPLKDWGRFRWQDEAVSLVWLYNRNGDEKLLPLLRLLKVQGWDWQAQFADFKFDYKVTRERIGLNEKASGDLVNTLKDVALSSHGVNHAMGIKTAAVWSLLSGKAADRDAVAHQLAVLDQFHGLPIGIFAADEHLAGRSPSQGVELCAIVEAMYSLEVALGITGDMRIADRIERIAYNALPATFTDDMWAHQYDQQPNQIQCSEGPGPWTTNGPESNLFGLEPHFGCCTANFHQGWPKLVAHLWMASDDDGLAALLYGPSAVRAQVRGVAVSVTERTDYPFRDRVELQIDPESEVSFPLHLRVPSWARGVECRLNGRRIAVEPRHGVAKIDRSWRRGDKVELRFENATELVRGFNDSVSVHHGALLYVHAIPERWQKLRQRGLSADWEVHPEGPWNYAIARNAPLSRVEREVGASPFARKTPAAVVRVSASVVPEWKAEQGHAQPPPQSPKTAGPARTLELIPYGAAKLRVTSFPSS